MNCRTRGGQGIIKQCQCAGKIIGRAKGQGDQHHLVFNHGIKNGIHCAISAANDNDIARFGVVDDAITNLGWILTQGQVRLIPGIFKHIT